MKTSLTDKINETLQNFEDIEKFRELIAEILAGKEADDAENEKAEEIISEETLSDRTEDLKKVIAAAKRMAAATGDEEVKKEAPFVDATEVDESVERMKQAADYAQGKIDFKEFTKRLIDRAEARVVVLAENLIDMADVAIAEIMERIKFLKPYVPIAKKVIPFLKPVVKKLVVGGIKKVAEIARKTIPVVLDKTIKVMNKVKEKILKIFS